MEDQRRNQKLRLKIKWARLKSWLESAEKDGIKAGLAAEATIWGNDGPNVGRGGASP
jgi:hypothetical protein